MKYSKKLISNLYFACKCQLNQIHSFQEFSIKNNNSKHFPIDIQYDFIASEIPSQQLDATEYLAFLYVTLNKVFVVKNVASFDPYKYALDTTNEQQMDAMHASVAMHAIEMSAR